MSEWNDALEAAAKLFEEGYTFVRRPLDPKMMAQKIEIYPGHLKTVEGDLVEFIRCAGDDSEKDVAAIYSLRRAGPAPVRHAEQRAVIYALGRALSVLVARSEWQILQGHGCHSGLPGAVADARAALAKAKLWDKGEEQDGTV